MVKASLDYFLKVPGHLFETEGRLLQQLAEGKRVLDIGTHHGRAAAAMAATAREVWTIDWGKGDSMIGAPDRTTKEQSLDGTGIVIVEADWVNWFQSRFDPDDWDMIFYDAAHRGPEPYEKDFLALVEDFPRLLIALHDHKPNLPEYRLAVEAMNDFAKRTGRTMFGPVAGSSIVWFEAVK
jgi:predicted nicotinamide N-methyase